MNAARFLSVLFLLSLCAIDAKGKAKSTGKPDPLDECLKLSSKGEKVMLECLSSLYKPKPGVWTFSEVTKSPINDAPSFSASTPSDTGAGSFDMGCHEGQLYILFSLNMYLNSMKSEYYPIIYRVDSEPALDCTIDKIQEKCYRWQLNSARYGAGIWDTPDEFIQEIKDGKKLTVRVHNISGEQRTAVFTLKDVLPTYEKVKSLCEAKPEGAE